MVLAVDFGGAITKAVLTTVFAAAVAWFVSQRHTWATVGVAALVLVPQLLYALLQNVGSLVVEDEKKRNRRVGIRADGWVPDDDETFAPSEVRERALRLRAEAEATARVAEAGTTFRERSRRREPPAVTPRRERMSFAIFGRGFQSSAGQVTTKTMRSSGVGSS